MLRFTANRLSFLMTFNPTCRTCPFLVHRCSGGREMLTILHIVWPPSFTQTPHNHLLWAEIGVYRGREDNILWRLSALDSKWPIEAIGVASLSAGQCLSLEHDVIHSVTNPLDGVTAGLHVYGGELSPGAPRSAWDGETLLERPLDYARDDRAVEAYNARLIESH